MKLGTSDSLIASWEVVLIQKKRRMQWKMHHRQHYGQSGMEEKIEHSRKKASWEVGPFQNKGRIKEVIVEFVDAR